MPTWLESITSPLSAASEGIQKLIETRDLIKFGDTLGKVQAQVLAAQQAALAGYTRELTLLEEIRGLKADVAKIGAWDTDRKRYERKNVGFGAYAYVLKKEERGGEPPHWVCTNCYEHGHIATLQYGHRKIGPPEWYCPSCNTTIHPGVSSAKWVD